MDNLFGMSKTQMRYELLTLLISIKPTNTKASTIIGLLDQYYDAIIAKEGEVIEFTLFEAEH